MANKKTWLDLSQSKEVDFVGGIEDSILVTINVKKIKGGYLAQWIASNFHLHLEKDIDLLEKSIHFQIVFILDETINADSESELLEKFKNKLEILSEVFDKSNVNMPLNKLENIDQKIRLFHWMYFRKTYKQLDTEIGIQRRTVIDYLLLQSLGLKDFATYISKEDKIKLLTVRDRLAYARRYGWIKKPGVGIRTSYMNKD